MTQAQADALNGLTVREFLAVADTALGGGPLPGNLTYNQLAGLTEKLTESFIDCQPSAFAQAHLCRPTFLPGEYCTFQTTLRHAFHIRVTKWWNTFGQANYQKGGHHEIGPTNFSLSAC